MNYILIALFVALTIALFYVKYLVSENTILKENEKVIIEAYENSIDEIEKKAKFEKEVIIQKEPFVKASERVKNETIPVFDSLGTVLSAKASPSIPLTNTSSISFYMFVATDQNDTHFQIISLGGVGFRVSSTVNSLFLTSAVSDLYTLRKTDGNNYPYPYGSWMHVVINMKTNNTADVYLNGVKITLAPKSATVWVFENTNFYIGHHSSTVKSFNNRLSDVRIFNRNLTQAEINSLRDRVRKNALELYHGSGEPLEEAKVINTTLNLDIPSFTDNATALNFGLEKDDLYLSGSNVLSTVQ